MHQQDMIMIFMIFKDNYMGEGKVLQYTLASNEYGIFCCQEFILTDISLDSSPEDVSWLFKEGS